MRHDMGRGKPQRIQQPGRPERLRHGVLVPLRRRAEAVARPVRGDPRHASATGEGGEHLLAQAAVAVEQQDRRAPALHVQVDPPPLHMDEPPDPGVWPICARGRRTAPPSVLVIDITRLRRGKLG